MSAPPEPACACGHPKSAHACRTNRGICYPCYGASDSGMRPYCNRYRKPSSAVVALRELPGGEHMTEINIPNEAYERAEEAVLAFDLVAPSDACDVASDAVRAAAPHLLAAELARLIEDRDNYNLDGTFRPVVLVKRMSELRKAGEQS